MKISKNAALNYITNETYFFDTREDRNNVFSGDNIDTGTTIAVAEDPNVDHNDWDSALWSIEKFNGANWVLESLDENYSLTVTDEGLAALAAIQEGKYIFDISCIKIKQNNIVDPSIPLTSWTDANFVSLGDVVLNTSWGDESFSLKNNKTLKWRSSLGNAGLQFTITIDADVYGYINDQRVENYTIGAIGLYIKDQRSASANLDGILFAIGNLKETISKYTTNATRVGNSVKLYLNLAISNLGHIANITSTPEDFHSLPEIATDSDLESMTLAQAVSAYPYNVYLVDNYQGSNAPALALRTMKDVVIDEAGVDYYSWKWTYLTPQDDTIAVPESSFENCKNYMVVAWDATKNKFVPADGDRYLDEGDDHSSFSGVLTGIKTMSYKKDPTKAEDDPENNYSAIIFAGNIRNYAYAYQYTASLSPTYRGSGYRTGDILYKFINQKQFFCTVTNVNDADMRVDAISEISPKGGDREIQETTFDYWHCSRRGDESDKSKVVRIKVTSTPTSAINYVWSFPADWINKPLYADIGENAGKLTTRPTECFVGWCTGTGAGNSSIKLALDLRNEATYADYGTTRYATHEEVNTISEGTMEITSITPKTLKNNYLQITLPGASEPTINPQAGISASNPIVIDTHTKFTKSIECTGTNLDGVAFKGTAYRALWGDLAEFYEADRIYPAGTLITMGSGEKEITIASKECNGVISDKPGYELGEKLTANHLPVALVGKVPVIFDNKCVPHFGDRVYLSRYEDGKASNENNGYCLGKVIDKRPNLDKHRSNVLCSIRISF